MDKVDENVIELIPSAKRLIKSLRDMGYDFNQAVADLIDNSIEAKATKIHITLEFEGDESWISITDDGIGMSAGRLAEAMRYGSDRDYSENDLGKFGLGMKTASMSQCQCLTVASKHRGSSPKFSAYSWDLDHIEKTNRWEILPVRLDDLPSGVQKTLLEVSSGTVVIWERLDRILGYKHPYGHHAQKQLSSMCRELENHLSMVFHNFIAPDDGRQPVEIAINGNVLKEWDPFCRGEVETKILDPILIDVEHEGARGQIVLLPYILPNRESFSSADAWELAGGPQGWNQQQGFYIYRAGRMIQAGSWSRLFAVDEHMKLARIAVLFDPILDEAFKVNVAKMRVQLPSKVRKEIREHVRPIRKQARVVYDKKDVGGLVVGKKQNDNYQDYKKYKHATNEVNLSGNRVIKERIVDIEHFENLLLDNARSTEKPIIRRVVDRVRRSGSS